MKNVPSRIDSNSGSIVLAAILLLGLFFRLYDLGAESLWLDEAVSVKYAELNIYRILLLREQTPPLYNVILHVWVRLFGISEFSIRFPSAVFGCFSLFLMYKIGSHLFDRDAGILSALLMAFSVFHIQSSQEARTYSLSVLLTLLSMYFFIKLLNKKSRRTFIKYGLSSTLLIYSHVYGLFIIIAQNIYFFIMFLLSKESRKVDVREWFSIQSLLVLLFSPWILIFIRQVAHIQKDFWIETPQISTIISSFKTYSSGSESLLFLFLAVLLFSFISFETRKCSIGLLLNRQVSKRCRWNICALDIDKIYFLLIWLMTPIVSPFIISHLSQPIYQIRYTIVASSAFYLLIARGICNVRNQYIKSIAIVTVVILSLIPIREYYAEVDNEQWREVAEYIDTSAHNEDIVLFNASYSMVPFNYYSRSSRIVKKGFPEKDRKVDETNINKLLETVEHHDRIWVVLAHSGDRKELIEKTLLMVCDLSYYKEYKNIKLYLFDRIYTHGAFRPTGS